MLKKIKKIIQLIRHRKLLYSARFYSGWSLFYSKKLKVNFLLNRNNYIDYIIFKNGIYGQDVINALSKIIKNNERYLFFDIGSNIGVICSYVSFHYKNVEIYSFEPIYENFIHQEMIKIINDLDYKSNNLAVGKENGELTLYLSKKFDSKVDFGKFNSGMPSIFCDNFRESSSARKVPLIKLDDYLSNNVKIDDSCILLFKIDVEGSELDVIKGMKSILCLKNKTYIIIEMLFSVRENIYNEVKDILLENNFSLFDINFNLISFNEKLKDGDYIFVKSTT